ncbi:MAG: heme-degrading domain-containing protein [Spirochaetaceae bacterium]
MSVQEDIKRISEEESRIRFDRFSHELGHRIGMALHEEARSRSVAVAIDVTAFGQRLFHLSMAGTTPDNDEWIERKMAVVLRFHKSSLRVGRELALDGRDIENRYYVDPRRYVAHGGSFPIRLTEGGVVGAVTVSGLAQEEDHALVVSVLERFL